MERSESFMRRAKKLGMPIAAGDIGSDLALLRESELTGRRDRLLDEFLECQISELEENTLTNPFLPPSPIAGLEDGDALILENDVVDVMVNFAGSPNQIDHVKVSGGTKMGKSCFQARLAAAASKTCRTLIFDSLRFYRQLPLIRQTHTFIRQSDLRLNLFQYPDGIAPGAGDQVVINELCESYSLIFGGYVVSEVLDAIRELNQEPSLLGVIERLKKMRYQGFSRRSGYRDSAVLVLGDLLKGTGELFRCSKGMMIEDLLQGNIVIELDGLPEHQAFVIRYLFEYVRLLMMNGRLRSWSKPLRVFLDEGQVLLAQKNFGSKHLQARHLNVGISINVQNASSLPCEVTTNSSLQVAFRCTDGRDRDAVKRSMGLNRDQAEKLGRLRVGECVGYFPSSGWPAPFLARVPRVEFIETSNDEIERESREYLSGFEWQSIRESEVQQQQRRHTGPFADLDAECEGLLRDVLNQNFECDPIGLRFERIGLRSGEKQGRVVKKLIAAGYVQVHGLAIGRGRPLKLLEPTEKACDAAGVKWKKTRGSLPTRVATAMVLRKVKKLNGWHWVREGDLAGKQCDLLGRNEKGEAIVVEIAGNAEHEVANALHCVRNDAERVWTVCLSGKIRDEVKRRYARHLELGGNDRVKVITLSEALKDEWTP